MPRRRKSILAVSTTSERLLESHALRRVAFISTSPLEKWPPVLSSVPCLLWVLAFLLGYARLGDRFYSLLGQGINAAAVAGHQLVLCRLFDRALHAFHGHPAFGKRWDQICTRVHAFRYCLQ